MNAGTLGVPKERIIQSILNEENMPAPQMFGYGALLPIILIPVTFYNQLQYSDNYHRIHSI